MKHLKARVKALESRNNSAELFQARTELAVLECDFKVGDIVDFGNKYQVVAVLPSYISKCTVNLRRIKPNGKLADSVDNLEELRVRYDR